MMKKSFLERRDLIVELLNEVPGVTCRTPGGAFYAWPNVTEACRMIGAADSEEFRKRLLERGGRGGARRHPLRRARAGRRPARALLLRRLEAGDRAGRGAHGRLHPEEHQRKWPEVSVWKPQRHRRGGHRARRQVPLRRGDDRRPARAQPARRAPRSRRVAASRPARAKCWKRPRTASSRPALVGIYRWHYAAEGRDLPAFLLFGKILGIGEPGRWTRKSSRCTGLRLPN